ncbi:class I SAM-dependent methyltransferase [Candidatus Pacearchaeota archaeon]|nr:class I SAM-dependent methyltransferase [Candidatus Pacearchaeota archaeon]
MNSKIEIQNYLKHLEEVPGWMGVGASNLMLAMDEYQTSIQTNKDYFEIGVHHGRSAILFGLLAKHKNTSLSVCDIFDNQEANLCKAGKGDLQAFKENYEYWIRNGKNLNIYECKSEELEKYISGKNFGFFHIDGGHTAKETFNDLELATKHLSKGGVIVLDDAFNYRFPGVAEGLNSFFTLNQDYTPFIIGKNKVILCKKDFYDEYHNYFDQGKGIYLDTLRNQSGLVEKQKYRGREVLIYRKEKDFVLKSRNKDNIEKNQ